MNGSLGQMTDINSAWNYEDLFTVIATGSLANLATLSLGGQQIGDEGMTSFSPAIATGLLGNLKQLYLYDNKIGNAGVVFHTSPHFLQKTAWRNPNEHPISTKIEEPNSALPAGTKDIIYVLLSDNKVLHAPCGRRRLSGTVRSGDCKEEKDQVFESHAAAPQ